MNTVISNLTLRSSRLLAAALPLPVVWPWRGWALDAAGRRRLALGFAAVGISAAILYVAAVNVILLGGESLRSGEARLKALEAEQARLLEIVSERQSPPWLEARSRAAGMVAVDAVRHLTASRSLALSR